MGLIVGLVFSAAQADKPTGEPVQIGLLAPLTGTQGVFGEDLVSAARMAVDEANAAGGVRGRPLELVIEDTETRPAPAMDAARKLIGVDDVPVLTGGFSSGAIVPVAEYAQKQEKLLVLGTPTSPKFRDVGDFLMSATVLDTFKGKALAEFIAEDSDAETFALAFMNNAFGQQLRKVTEKRLQELGKEVVTTVDYQLNKTDYRPELERLYSEDPDAIVGTFYADEGLIWAKQAYKAGYLDMNETPWYIGEVTTSFASAMKENPEILKGVKGLDPLEPKQLFGEKFKERTGHEPVTAFAAQWYDAVRMIAMAMNFSNSTNPAEIRDAMYVIDDWYRGMSYGGDKRFDEDGMLSSAKFRKVRIEDGGLSDYQP
jgi:branched-chain amino acid transport system substrate-binding protein